MVAEYRVNAPASTFNPNPFNYAELENVSAQMLQDFKAYEEQLRPRVLYHWASDHEIKQIQKEGLGKWLEQSKFFWRTPLGSFMYGENRLEKGQSAAEGGRPNLIRIKLKPDTTFITSNQYHEKMQKLGPRQVVTRDGGVVPVEGIHDFSANSFFSFFEYALMAQWDPSKTEERTRLLLDTIESVSVNHPDIKKEFTYELERIQAAQERRMPYFDSYVRINGIPEVVAPWYQGVESKLRVDGHAWTEEILYQRANAVIRRAQNKTNAFIMYAPGVSETQSPHMAEGDLAPQIFTSRALDQVDPTKNGGKGWTSRPPGGISCRDLFK